MTPLAAVLAFCHKDFDQALRWLRWVKFLQEINGKSVTLFIVGTRSISNSQWDMIRACCEDTHWMPCVLEGENEGSYPVCSNFLFVNSLAMVSGMNRDVAILFCEPDTVPMRADWFDRLEEEFNAAGKPFCGAWIDHCVPHMAGCGIYGPEWKERAPSILQCVTPEAGAFDTFCAHEIVPQMHRTKLIYQIWRSFGWTPQNLGQIPPETCLFHQDKGGSLITALAATRFPGFKD